LLKKTTRLRSRLSRALRCQTMSTSHTAFDNIEHNETVSSGHIIYSEILSVTSVMRKNSRWSSSLQTFYTKDSALASNLGLRRPGSSNVSTPQQGSREEDLMSGFEELKRSLRGAQGMCGVSDVQDLSKILLSHRHLVHIPHRYSRSFPCHHSLTSVHGSHHVGCSFRFTLVLCLRPLLEN
jgi:hypothetical protein